MGPANSPPSNNYLMTFGIRCHEYVNGYINFADQKAGFFLALSTGLLLFIHDKHNLLGILKSFPSWQLCDVLIVMAFVSLFLALLSSVLVVMPRVKPTMAAGLVFWVPVARNHNSRDTYFDAVAKLSELDAAKEVIGHHWELSVVCEKKYQALKHATRFCFIGTLLSVFGVILSTPAGVQVKDLIKLGAIVPQTGAFAVYGIPVSNGMNLALEEINARGRLIDLIIEDDGGDPKSAVNAFVKLSTVDRVPAIIGPLSSGASLATAPIAEREKVVQLSTLAGTIELSNAGDYVFRIYPSSEVGSKYIAGIALERFKARRVALMYANDAFGVTARRFVAEVLKKNGIAIVADETFNAGASDFRSQISKIREARPDVVICSAYYEDGAKILVQSKQLGLAVPILGEDGWFGPIANRVGKALNQLYFANVAFGKDVVDNQRMQTFIKAYSAKFGIEATAGSAVGYDAVYLLKEIIDRVGTDPSRIQEALYQIDFKGAFGNIRFDRRGDNVGATYALFQLNANDEPVVIK
jgi:branched-chain amino acid transport system substrate-binding protein